MMRKKCLPLLLIAGVVVLFASTGIYAGKDVADSFIIESPEYTKRTRNNVEFTHNNHITEYKIGCGECHHDENNKPLADLKIGDDVQRCIECHKIPGRKRPPRGEKWPREKILEYHANAVHDNCIPCHREHNKKNNTKAAPATCRGCHPGKK